MCFGFFSEWKLRETSSCFVLEIQLCGVFRQDSARFSRFYWESLQQRDSRENRLCLLDIFISMLLFLQRVKLAAFEEHFAEKVCVHCCVVRVLMLLILNAMLELFPVQSWKRNLLICLCEIYDLKLFHFILFIAINNNFTLLP